MKRFLIACPLLYFSTAYAQCISTSFANATSFTTDNSIGSYNFSSPANAQSSDNSRATASSLIGILSADTYYLRATGFNFSIPSYSSICGITVEAECRATGLLLTAAIRDNSVRLIKGGIITGNNYALSGDWGSSDNYRNYGGSNDLWGTTLTPADVNASNFGVAFSASIIALIAALPSAQIDHIALRVDYNPILPVHLAYFSGTESNNNVKLQWQTTEEEDHAFIILQRAKQTGHWQDTKQWSLSSYHNNKQYSYEDAGLGEGSYSYRLKIIAASGAVTYSETRFLTIRHKDEIQVYPNPATDYITVASTSSNIQLRITDMLAREWNVPLEKTQPAAQRIDIRRLPTGIYFLSAGFKTLKFIKE